MYKVAKMTVTSKIVDRDEIFDRLEGLLFMLYKNGQILKTWIIEDYEDYFEVRVTTTDDDSLNPQYYNQYIKKELENFTIETKILTNDAGSTDCCHCDDHSFYIITPDPDMQSSPIICGDCGKEIPLIKIPYLFNEEEHYSILDFQFIYTSVDNLWINSLSDRFTKRQITQHNSQLNKLGLNIRQELEKKVNKPVYLFIANPIRGWFGFKKEDKILELCPKCGGEFKSIGDHADKVCESCRLAFL